MKKALCLSLFLAACTLLVLSGCSNPGGGSPSAVDNSKFLTGSGIPSNSVGADGDLYLDTANLVLYVKTSGAWANVGVLRGPAGTGWIVGTGAPGSSLGSSGDLYLDTTNMLGYQKQAGGWTVLFSFAPDTPWFVGQTPESAPTNPKVGDLYLDLLSTMVYQWSGSVWMPLAAFQVAIPQYVFTPNFIGYMYGIAYGNNTFVAVGDAGTMVYSTDGTNWDYFESIAGTEVRFGSVVGGTASSASAKSPLTAAQLANHQKAVQRRAAFNRTGSAHQGIFEGGGYSTGLTYYLTAVAYGGGYFVAVGWDTTNNYGVMLTSTDGIYWAYESYDRSPLTPCTLSGVAYANGQFVVSGTSSNDESGVIIVGVPGGIWQVVVPTGGCGSLSAAAGDGADTLVVGGDNVLGSYSYSGTTWSSPMWPSGAYYSDYGWIYGVAYGAGKFVAVGSGSTTSILTSGTPVSSTSWTTQDLPLSNNVSLYAITYGPSGFAAVGTYGTILTSPDGVSWAMQNWYSGYVGEGWMSNTSEFFGVTWGVVDGKVLYAIAQSDASML